jgi:hypothetical protein
VSLNFLNLRHVPKLKLSYLMPIATRPQISIQKHYSCNYSKPSFYFFSQTNNMSNPRKTKLLKKKNQNWNLDKLGFGTGYNSSQRLVTG